MPPILLRKLGKMDLIKIRKQVNTYLIKYRTARKQCKDEKLNLQTAEDDLKRTEEAQQIIQQLAQEVQQQVHNKIAVVVNKCLETVFGYPFNFQIHFERKRGRTEARLSFEGGGADVNPMNEDSGGAVDVASFALRLSSLLLTKPKLRRVVGLDEPFKFVDVENRENIKILMKGLAKDFGIQFIMITREPDLQIGKVIEL